MREAIHLSRHFRVKDRWGCAELQAIKISTVGDDAIELRLGDQFIIVSVNNLRFAIEKLFPANDAIPTDQSGA